jgi:hypothetical protein
VSVGLLLELDADMWCMHACVCVCVCVCVCTYTGGGGRESEREGGREREREREREGRERESEETFPCVTPPTTTTRAGVENCELDGDGRQKRVGEEKILKSHYMATLSGKGLGP